MSTKRVLSFLQKGWTAFVDPDREERLSRGVSIIHRALSEQRDAFDLAATAEKHQIDSEDWAEIARRVYQKCLTKAWSDGEVSAKELRTLDWVARHLRLSEQDASQLKREQAEQVFAAVLSEAFQDGVLDEAEFARLTAVASTCEATAADFFQSRFREQGEGFLRSLFLRALEDGELDQRDWKLITATVAKMGLSEAHFHAVIEGPAQQFAEHLLADFKSDEEISPEEDEYLSWIIRNCIRDHDFTAYIRTEIAMVKRRSQIRKGVLPTISPPQWLPAKAGELVHFVGSSRFISAKRRRDGSAAQVVFGQCAITDHRFVFASTEYSQQINHTKILGLQRQHNGLEIQCSGSAAGYYAFLDSINWGTEIWISAIQKANQTLLQSHDKGPSRHIPRDVRQRVWQRYGGRCAECNSTHYLEFDHIIPVTRGGGNSDNNVQLLCRGCNGRKSDNI